MKKIIHTEIYKDGNYIDTADFIINGLYARQTDVDSFRIIGISPNDGRYTTRLVVDEGDEIVRPCEVCGAAFQTTVINCQCDGECLDCYGTAMNFPERVTCSSKCEKRRVLQLEAQ